MVRHALPFLSAALLLAVAGCDTRTVPVRDGGITDGMPPTNTCTPGVPGFRCEGNIAVQCLEDGSEGTRMSCGESGLVCSPGVGAGCTVCRANSFQCNGNNVERCNPEGSAWTPMATCDGAAGQTCNAVIGACTSPCDDAAAANSYIGCDYWPVTTMNSQVEDDFVPAIVVSNPQVAAATVTVTGPSAFSQTRTVAPGATETIELPWVAELKRTFADETSSLVRGGAYHVQSTLPVTVYQFNPLEYRLNQDCIDAFGECDPSTVDDFFGLPQCDGVCFSYSNDASLLLPTHVMTGNYIVMSQPTLQIDGGGAGSPGFFAVVGVSATPVTVNVQFRANVVASADGQIRAYGPGESGSFMLNQGDVLQIASATPSSCTPNGTTGTRTHCLVGEDYDLSGTEIRASGPVEVIGGHNCAFVPSNRFACDHLEQVLFPLETWGTESILSRTMPPEGRAEPNLVRILSGADGNTITFEPSSVGGGSVTLNRGQSAEFEAMESFRAQGTGPFLMGQFIVGQSYLPSTSMDSEGDPGMSLGIPSEQFRTEYTFLAPTTYPTNFVNVTAPAGATVTLDGTPVSGFNAVGGTGFAVAQVPITAGTHSITSSQPFGIVVYGYGQFTSYMYPGGLDFEQINPLI